MLYSPLLLSQDIETVAEAAEKGFEITGAYVITSFELFGISFNLTSSVAVQWLVMLLLGTLFFVLGRNLKVKPEGKRQMIAEMLAGFASDMVRDGMGEKYRKWTPYIATLLCFSICNSLAGLLGFSSPTGDLSVILAWGIITFIMVQRNKFKTGGVKGFFKSFVEPLPFMLPFNIIGELANPLSQSFRHFGNIMAGGIIMGLIYWALGYFAVFVPAVLSLYFDLFGAVVQAYIFATLTMTYVANADCS
ncbi:MAG: F0F1 ATP synthase subunit A [Oscillospiraceae bacterium]|nr:F0F1 ATP synthase subunit A [Oscillospiraceae bacterium]